MVSFVAYGQEPSFPENQKAPGESMMPQVARGEMAPGMQGPGREMQGPRPGMQAPGAGMRGGNEPRMMPGRPEGGPGDPVAEILRPEVQKELAITAEQRQKLEDIRFNTEKESIQRRAAIQVQRMELSRLTEAENPDRPAIDKKIQEMGQEDAALMRAEINARLNAKAVLTSEQRTKLAQFRQNRKQVNRQPQADGRMQPGQPAAKVGPGRDRAPQPATPPKAQEK
jgi:Spy/CpxP family protein refolding chaperone